MQLDDDRDYSDEEFNRTQPFTPAGTSTPGPLREHIKMYTLPHEQSSLPSYDESISFLENLLNKDDRPAIFERVKTFIKDRFPTADFGELGPIGFSKIPGNETKIVRLGPQGDRSDILRKNGNGFLKSFTDRFKTTLGLTAQDIVAQDSTNIRETRRNLKRCRKGK